MKHGDTGVPRWREPAPRYSESRQAEILAG
jgi:hypothetical protein